MKSKRLLEESKGRIKITAITGIRSDYDHLYPLLNAINVDRCFDLKLIVSGAHLSPLHNYSIREIEKDSLPIAGKIENLLYSNSLHGKAMSAAVLMQGVVQVLSNIPTDLLIVLGDREEPLVGALAASYMNIPVIHIAGGDNQHPEGGDVDEGVRHATTKLSHIHLTMTDEHSRRIIRLGEEEWRVFTVGSGGIDRLKSDMGYSISYMKKILGEAISKDYIVLIQHVLSSEVKDAAKQMRISLKACLQTGCEVFVGAPNSDPGFHEIERTIEDFKKSPRIHFYRNLNRKAFVSLLRHAKCVVGNSSLGLTEAPFIGLPAVNVGERQRGRTAGENVQFVPFEVKMISSAIKKAIYDKDYRQSIKSCRTLYGDGFMAEKSIKIIKALPSKKTLLAKRNTF